jgi:hypothetical protein
MDSFAFLSNIKAVSLQSRILGSYDGEYEEGSLVL